MDRFDAMQLFVHIVELGSFTRAAEQMGLQRATATQAIQQLEARLGVRLLQRTTRHVSVTSEGQAYHQRCLAILAEVAEADNAFTQGARQLKGVVRVDLSGSTAYLRRHGVPLSLDGPNGLDGHRAVNYVSASSGKAVPLEFMVDGELQARALPGSITVNNGDAYVAACEAGFGLIQLPRYHVMRQLAAGTLGEVLAQHRPPALPLSVLYPHRRHVPLRVRVFVDWLAELFQG